MPRYLVEIQHSDEHEGCIRALDALMTHGSHLMTNAEFGCGDGVHTGWLIVDVDSIEDAQRIVPPQFRTDARIVKLRTWTKAQIQEMIASLGD